MTKHNGTSKGISAYAKVWVSLPATSSEVAQKTGISRDWVQKMLTQLRFQGVIYRCGVEDPRGDGRFREAIHAAGSGVNKPYLGRLVGPPKKISAHAIAFASILKAMADPKSIAEITEETGLSRHTVYKCVKTLRNAGKAYLCSYNQRHGAPSPEFTLGSRWDAKRPDPISKSELNRRYNARRREREAAERVASAWRPAPSVFHLEAA